MILGWNKVGVREQPGRHIEEVVAHRTVVAEPAVANLVAARQLGFTTVLVGLDEDSRESVDHYLPDLLDLPMVMPKLWEI